MPQRLQPPFAIAFWEESFSNFSSLFAWKRLNGLQMHFERLGVGDHTDYSDCELVIVRSPDSPDLSYRLFLDADAAPLIRQAWEAVTKTQPSQDRDLVIAELERCQNVTVLVGISYDPTGLIAEAVQAISAVYREVRWSGVVYAPDSGLRNLLATLTL